MWGVLNITLLLFDFPIGRNGFLLFGSLIYPQDQRQAEYLG